MVELTYPRMDSRYGVYAYPKMVTNPEACSMDTANMATNTIAAMKITVSTAYGRAELMKFFMIVLLCAVTAR